MNSDINHWKLKYEKLVDAVASFGEAADDLWKREIQEVPEEPYFIETRPLYVSNHMELCDNEESAIKNWGEGRYHKYVPSTTCKTDLSGQIAELESSLSEGESLKIESSCIGDGNFFYHVTTKRRESRQVAAGTTLDQAMRRMFEGARGTGYGDISV